MVCSLLPLSGSIGACDDNDWQCAAAGIDRIDLDLYRTEWPSGEYTMRLAYEARALGPRELECVFVLSQQGGEVACEEDGLPFEGVSIGATVAIRLESAPRTLELELESPDGATRERTITPRYTSYELCGSTYYIGDEIIPLDDE